MEKLPLLVHGKPITDHGGDDNMGAEHRLLLTFTGIALFDVTARSRRRKPVARAADPVALFDADRPGRARVCALFCALIAGPCHDHENKSEHERHEWRCDEDHQ